MTYFTLLIALISILFGVLLGWILGLGTRRRLKHSVRFLQTLITHTPVGLFYQDIEGNAAPFTSHTLSLFFNLKSPAKWSNLLKNFDLNDAEKLNLSFRSLRKNGTPFSLTLPTLDKSFHFIISGYPISTPRQKGVFVVFQDVSQFAHKLQLSTLIEHHKNILATAIENLPFPLFIRDTKGLAFFANNAVNQEKTNTLNDLSWLSIPFQAEKELYTLTYGQETKTEEELALILQNMLTAQRRLCEALPCAVCLFNSVGQMLACSQAFADLWHLDKKWIKTEPSYEDYWDAIQDNGLLSRVADFANYKKQQRENFARLSSTNEIFLYLPNGKIVRRMLIPYVQGSVILLDEDQTKK